MESDKKEKLNAYLSEVKAHGPKPGTNILNQYLKNVSDSEMEKDMKAYIDFCKNRHKDETIVLLATGSSIKTLDLEFIKDNFTTIGCNGIGQVFDPNYYIICDPYTYGLHNEVFLKSKGVRILSSFTEGDCDKRIYYKYENLIGLEDDEIYSADNTGFVMLSTAFVMGAKRFILAGFDGKFNNKDSHCYTEKETERERFLHEWDDIKGSAQTRLLVEGFKHAVDKIKSQNKEIFLLTESAYLNNIISPISWDDLIKLSLEE